MSQGKEKNQHTSDPKYVKLAYNLFIQEKRMEIIHAQIDRYDASMSFTQASPIKRNNHIIIDLELISEQVNRMWKELSKKDTEKYRARAMLEMKRRRVATISSQDDKRRSSVGEEESTVDDSSSCLQLNSSSLNTDDNSISLASFKLDPTMDHSDDETRALLSFFAMETTPDEMRLRDIAARGESNLQVNYHENLRLHTKKCDISTQSCDIDIHIDAPHRSDILMCPSASFPNAFEQNETVGLNSTTSSKPVQDQYLISNVPKASPATSDDCTGMAEFPVTSSVPLASPNNNQSITKDRKTHHSDHAIRYLARPYPPISVPHSHRNVNCYGYQAPQVPLSPFPIAYPLHPPPMVYPPPPPPPSMVYTIPPPPFMGYSPMYSHVPLASYPPPTLYNVSPLRDMTRPGPSSTRNTSIPEKKT